MRRVRDLALLVGLTLPMACAALYGVGDLPSDVGALDGSSEAARDARADAAHPHDAAHDTHRPGDASDASQVTDAREGSPVEMEAEAASMVASVTPSPAQVSQGSSVMLTVTLASPATADFAISLTSLPGGVTASAGSIPQGASSGVVTLSASASATEGVTTPTAHAAGGALAFTLVVAGASATLDTSFNESGVLNIAPSGGGSMSTARSMAMQADGSIVVAGTLTDSVTSGWALVRLNPDGTPDATFNANVVDASKGALLPAGGNLAGVAVVQSSGLIVVAGYDTDGGDNQLAVMLYNSDGTRHESFGTAGLYERGGDEEFHVTTVTGVAVDPAGDIAVVGNATTPYVLTLTGPTNSSLNIGGTFPSTVALEGVAYEPNGDLVVGGSDPASGGQLYVGRVNSSLTSESFADGGVFGPPAGGGNQYLTAAGVAVDPSGNIFVVGDDDAEDPTGAFVAVSNAGVALVNGYALPGPNIMGQSGFVAVACGLTDNLAVVVGNGYDMAGSQPYVARIKSTGALDTTFASSGVLLTTSPTAPSYNAVAIDSVGRIVVAGGGVGFYVTRIWP